MLKHKHMIFDFGSSCYLMLILSMEPSGVNK